MKKIRDFFVGISNFMNEVVLELKKSEWPGRSELVESTAMVIMSVVILGVFVGLSDLALIKALKMIIGRY